MKRGYNQVSTYKKAYPYKKRAYVSQSRGFSGIGPQKFGANRYAAISYKNNIFGKYSNNFYKKNGELKTLDSTFTGVYNAGVYTPDTVQTAPYIMLPLNAGVTTIQALNLCQQGAGISQRVGHKISLKSLRIRMTLSETGKLSLYENSSRILVIYDRQPGTTYPAANVLLASINGGNVVVPGIFTDGINPNLMDRLVVLMDEFIITPPFTTAGVSATYNTSSTEMCNYHIDRFIKLKNLDTTFNNTNSTMTVSLISTGALYILCYGEATVNGSDAFQLYGSCRLRYHDN